MSAVKVCTQCNKSQSTTNFERHRAVCRRCHSNNTRENQRLRAICTTEDAEVKAFRALKRAVNHYRQTALASNMLHRKLSAKDADACVRIALHSILGG